MQQLHFRKWQENKMVDCVLQEDVMRFTGLHDKNRKPIYEGDIVDAWLCFGPGGDEKRRYEVKITPHGVNLERWTFREEGMLPVVVGNVREHPHLLNEKSSADGG